jgi:hypothetical protein
MVPSHIEISRGALAFIDQFARATTGFEVVALITMTLALARAALMQTRNVPCASRS